MTGNSLYEHTAWRHAMRTAHTNGYNFGLNLKSLAQELTEKMWFFL